jgi:hypothetical protein
MWGGQMEEALVGQSSLKKLGDPLQVVIPFLDITDANDVRLFDTLYALSSLRSVVLSKWMKATKFNTEVNSFTHIIERYVNGVLHSIDDRPAVECMGIKMWYRGGELHRDGDRPAIEHSDGGVWYRYGKRHRDGDRPAVMRWCGDKEWWRDGKRHRDGNRPAIERRNGFRMWYREGALYRDGGRPVIEYTGSKCRDRDVEDAPRVFQSSDAKAMPMDVDGGSSTGSANPSFPPSRSPRRKNRRANDNADSSAGSSPDGEPSPAKRQKR